MFSRRGAVDFNLVYIPGTFPDTSTQTFDPVYMTKLFDVGLGFRAEWRAVSKKVLPRWQN